jgi:hypothetical protein
MKKEDYKQLLNRIKEINNPNDEEVKVLKNRIELELPFDSTDNGFCYKIYDFKNADWDDIVYIPEYSDDDNLNLVSDDEEDTLDSIYDVHSVYSKHDFYDIASGQEFLAIALFQTVDWQHPETLLDEWWQCGTIDELIEEGLIAEIEV